MRRGEGRGKRRRDKGRMLDILVGDSDGGYGESSGHGQTGDGEGIVLGRAESALSRRFGWVRRECPCGRYRGEEHEFGDEARQQQKIGKIKQLKKNPFDNQVVCSRLTSWHGCDEIRVWLSDVPAKARLGQDESRASQSRVQFPERGRLRWGSLFFQWGGLCTTTGRTEEALKIGAKQRCATRQDDGFQGLKGGFAGCAFCTHTPPGRCTHSIPTMVAGYLRSSTSSNMHYSHFLPIEIEW